MLSFGPEKRNANGPAVLIVDSDANARRLIECAFAASGFLPIATDDAAVAFETAACVHPCLSVIDIRRDRDTWSLLQRLKRDGRTAEIPLLAVAEDAGRDDHHGGAAADALLIQPVSPTDVVTTGQLLVERDLLRREHSRRARVEHAASNANEGDGGVRSGEAEEPHVRCRGCGADDVEVVRHARQSSVYRCRRCHFVWRRSRS